MLKKMSACFFAIIIDSLGFGLVYPVFTAMFTATHSPILAAHTTAAARHFYLGLGFLLYPLCMFFGASFLGDLSDIWGRKKVLIVCMAGITISFAIMGGGVLANSLSLVLLGRAFSGIMAGSQTVAQAAIADLSTSQTKARNLSLISLSYCFGVIFGPIIGGLLTDKSLVNWFNYSIPFILSAILALISCFWLVYGFTETKRNLSNEKKISLFRPITIFIEAFKHKSVRNLAIVFLLMQVGFGIYFQFIIIHMKYIYHYSNWQLGAVQGMLGIGFGLGVFIGIPFASRYFTTKIISIICLSLTGLGACFAAMINTANIQWFNAIAVACFDMMAYATILTLFSNSVDENSQGWVMGISSSIMAIAWVISGLFSNLIGIITTAHLIGYGGIILLSSSYYLYIKRNKVSSYTSHGI